MLEKGAPGVRLLSKPQQYGYICHTNALEIDVLIEENYVCYKHVKSIKRAYLLVTAPVVIIKIWRQESNIRRYG